MTTKRRKKRVHFGQIIRENRWYFLPYFLLLTIAVFILTTVPVGNEDLYFVQFRGSIWDDIFKVVTQFAEPIIITIVILSFLFISFRKTLSLLSAIALMLSVSSIAKLIFKHDRPVLYFHKLDRLADLPPVEGLQLLTGDTSFPSGHTMGAFTIYTLVALYTQNKTYGIAFLLLSASVGFSRIYLGQHFLKDVVAGSITGVVIAIFIYHLFERWIHLPKLNRNLLSSFRKK